MIMAHMNLLNVRSYELYGLTLILEALDESLSAFIFVVCYAKNRR